MAQPNQLYTVADVAKIFNVCSRTIKRWVAEGSFPKPIRLGGKSVRWEPDIIGKFRQELIAEAAATD